MGKWKMVRLGDVCDVRDGTHSSPKYVAQGYPLITSKNVTKGYLDFSDVNLISLEDLEEINKRSKVDIGDIIMPMIGTIGQPTVVETMERPFAIKNVALIKFNDNQIYNAFIKNILESTWFSKYIDKASRGGTQKFLSLKDIRDFSFSLPPLSIQQEIVDILNRTNILIEKRKIQIKKLDLLVKSHFVTSDLQRLEVSR
jgi:type I restriction enzyme S subunit